MATSWRGARCGSWTMAKGPTCTCCPCPAPAARVRLPALAACCALCAACLDPSHVPAMLAAWPAHCRQPPLTCPTTTIHTTNNHHHNTQAAMGLRGTWRPCPSCQQERTPRLRLYAACWSTKCPNFSNDSASLHTRQSLRSRHQHLHTCCIKAHLPLHAGLSVRIVRGHLGRGHTRSLLMPAQS